MALTEVAQLADTEGVGAALGPRASVFQGSSGDVDCPNGENYSKFGQR